jgi:hypothetical protein
MIAISSFCMLNWSSLYSQMHLMKVLLSKNTTNQVRRDLYDWQYGHVQFTIGMIFLFAGLIALEGSTLSLLSKICPGHSRALAMNVGTLVTILGLISRCFADLYILVVDFSNIIMTADIINALLIPILFCSLVIAYWVNKHYFYLM